jgi:hypothetical protein
MPVFRRTAIRFAANPPAFAVLVAITLLFWIAGRPAAAGDHDDVERTGTVPAPSGAAERTATVPAPSGAAERTVVYIPPHAGAVVRPFSAPSTPYGPGHRGVDLDARPGDVIVSAADGEVAWAGSIAGRTWVSIVHAEGIRTSYGPLTDLQVRGGTAVRAGQPLGRLARGGHGHDSSDRGLHWSARRGGTYLDPMGLLRPSLLRPALVGPGGWAGTAPVVEPYDDWEGKVRLGVFLQGSPIARRPGYAVAPNWHHLVLLPGLNSADGMGLDPAFLGYAGADATIFSYTGCEPTPTGCQPRPYQSVDTHHGIDRAARDLRDLLRELQRAQPGRPVDLVGHSQGGVVADHYLRHYHDPLDPTLPPIGNLVTFAAPFGGAPLANLGDSTSQNIVSWALEGLVRSVEDLTGSERLGGYRLTSPSIRDNQLSLLDRSLAITPAPPQLQVTPRTHHVAGSRDFVVPSDRAAPSDATPTFVPGGHGRMVRTEAAHQVAYDFLAGDAVPQGIGWGVGYLAREVGVSIDQLAFFVDAANIVMGDYLPVAPGIPLGTNGYDHVWLPEHDSVGRPTRP